MSDRGVSTKTFSGVYGRSLDELQTTTNSVVSAVRSHFFRIYAFANQGTRYDDRFESLLQQANINIPRDLYVSTALAGGAAFGGLVGLIALTLTVLGYLGPPVVIPSEFLAELPALARTTLQAFLIGFELILLYIVFASMVGMCVGLGAAYLFPYLRAKGRDRKISLILPDAISFMYILSKNGSNQMEIVRSIAAAEDTYGEFAVEFKRIIVLVDNFDMHFDAAVREVADLSPNDDIAEFLTDMLSILDSGGDIVTYLQDAKQEQRRGRERKMERVFSLLQIMGQAYTVFVIGPMLLLILLVVMSLMGTPRTLILALTVYVAIPAINFGYGLAIGWIKVDEVGEGTIQTSDGEVPRENEGGLLSPGPIVQFVDNGSVFRQIYRKQLEHVIKQKLTNWPKTLANNPFYSFAFTIPAMTAWVTALAVTGFVPLSLEALKAEPLGFMNVYFFFPFGVIVGAYALLHELRRRKLAKVTDSMPDDLRKLANTNGAGEPLHEALNQVSETTDSKFADEMGRMYKKLQLNISLERSIAEFNNKYRIPRLARMMKILQQAQLVSTEIPKVVETAAEAAAYQQRVKKERRNQMLLQVIVIEMSFLVILGILAVMQGWLIDQMITMIGQSPTWPNFENIDPAVLDVFFLHAVTIQAIMGGILVGYVYDGNIRDGLKWSLLNSAAVIVVWTYNDIIANLLGSTGGF